MCSLSLSRSLLLSSPLCSRSPMDSLALASATPSHVWQLRSAWTRVEDDIILSSVNEFGPKWVEIAARLPGRTEHAARNRYHRLASRAPGQE